MMMKIRFAQIQRLLPAFVLLITCGCGSGAGDAPKRYPVTGTVSLSGIEISTGDILFLPADGQGRADGGKIKDGKFSFEAPAGKKRVEITATREEGIAPDGLPNYVMYIPAKYNTKSELTAEVTADGENVFPFELKP